MRTATICLFVCLAGCLLSAGLLAAVPSSLGPIPPEATGASFDPAAATRAYLATVPAEAHARSDAYSEGGYWLILWNFLLTLAINILLLATGWSAAWRDRAIRCTRRKWIQVALYAVIYVLVVYAFSFPLTAYQLFFREHQYGMATQHFGSWFGEQMIGLGLQVIGFVLALIAFYALCRRAPRTWWIWGTGVALFFLVVSSLIAPVVIQPLFNKYQTLNDPALRDPILAMAQANQIPVKQVFEVDASRQTKRVSANVSGFLGTAQIALNDNLLRRCSLPEIRFVMAHEMGHYVLNHIYKLLLYYAFFLAIGFALISVVFELVRVRWDVKIRALADPAGFPLLFLILTAYAFLFTPIINTVIRVTEREADAFGLNCSREADGFAQVALKLGEYRKLDPGPVEEFILFDHPSGRARIRMAMDWKAAHLPGGGN
jgi:STE24 endopeptidase